MEEIKVGEYVRTESGYIGKVEQINKEPTDENITYVITDVHSCFLEEVIKHSPNIIDLIEVGDYVNGSLVTDVDKKTFTVIQPSGGQTTHHKMSIRNIKSIVTKEQFESIEYKVGD